MLEEHRDSVRCAANLVSHSATTWDLKNVHPLLLGPPECDRPARPRNYDKGVKVTVIHGVLGGPFASSALLVSVTAECRLHDRR